MIQEAYCSYEVSKLLKEKGFNEKCIGAYSYTNHSITKFDDGCFNEQLGELMYSVPTHQMAMRWIREKHNLCIAPYAAAYRYGFTIDKADTGSHLYNETIISNYDEIESWEEAVEASLKYSLENLI